MATPVASVFGNGILGHAVTGLVRIPAFMANVTAVMMVGELAIRGLNAFVEQIGFTPKKDGWVDTAAKKIIGSGIRPYSTMALKDLAIRTVAFIALGVVATEFVRILAGAAPAIYNNVLSFIGPIRIDSRPYLTVINSMF